MQSGNAFNNSTVDWQAEGVEIDTQNAAEFSLDDEGIARYQRDGVILLRGAFSDWVEPLRNGFQRNLEYPERYAFPCESNPEGAPGRFFDSYCNWQLIPEYLDFVTHSGAASLAAQCMRSEGAQFFHEHAFLKAPGTQHATPWHQDLPYYCVDGTQTASVYISLDHANEDVAVRFVKGSHRWRKLFRPRVFLDGSDFSDDASVETVPDIDADPEQYDIVSCSLEPGDTLVFDFRTLHGTGNAEVKTQRRAFSTRWLGDDAVFCERPGETSPPYTNHGMQHGERMREDWFPVFRR